ncbi:hypothetical protein FRC03_008487 [Tulasnella sp. 419]|nr:hypothetical protein FRC02_009191 [Tulasnella sp. 418]KAG8968134.1 hypothetical protein FRC03_008487 [Tulasnella sp. 419]
MKLSTFCLTVSLFASAVFAQDDVTANPVAAEIISNAEDGGINLLDLPFATDALSSIVAVTESNTTVTPTERKSRRSSTAATKIDAHVHVIPDWYRALVPTTGGNPTPAWDVASHLQFMSTNGIGRSILAISAPGSSVYPGNQIISAGLARLLNEWVAALVRSYPTKFSFYAVVPLPFTDAAIAEAKYALDNLGAVGIILLSNHEGKYLGNPEFKKFFQYMNTRGKGREIVYVHPNTPWLQNKGQLIEANPTLYPTGLFEFYFETARVFMDLTATQTIHNFTNIHYVIPHVGGSFPSIIDRFIKSLPALEASSKQIYKTRFWWDSAGPTYFAQVKGLLGYDIPTSQLLFGTDYPYAPIFTYGPSIAAIDSATYITATDKTNIFTNNVKTLFGNKISW